MQVQYTGGTVDKIPVTLNPGNASKPPSPFAVIHFDRLTVYVQNTDDAYAVIAAGVAALRLLDPDAPVQLADDVTAADPVNRIGDVSGEDRCLDCGTPASEIIYGPGAS